MARKPAQHYRQHKHMITTDLRVARSALFGALTGAKGPLKSVQGSHGPASVATHLGRGLPGPQKPFGWVWRDPRPQVDPPYVSRDVVLDRFARVGFT